MRSSVLVFAVGCSMLVFGCADAPDETQEIIDNLVHADFPRNDIMVVDGKVYVGRDAEVSLAASREMLQVDSSDDHEQYRTTNLISRSLTTICVDIRACANHSSKFATALTNATNNYTALNLTFNMSRRTTDFTGCSARITCRLAHGVTGGSSGFPSGGLPFGTINIGTGLDSATFSTDTVAHVMTHEIGHAIGFRHSDWFNRSISCGSGGSEGGGIGAILIPDTPSGATVGGSIMNACFRTSETGEFTASDVTALRALYGVARPPGVNSNIAFQANTSVLWVVGPGGPGPTGLGMAAGTSPSITALSSGGYQVAFQANTG
ncbi:MAG: hypothetical protein E6J91_15675, partial [Deltaproteobacteria bacterium]